jgi:CBS domain containing-hemolysin-like protein
MNGELPELARLVQPMSFVPESLRAHRLVRFFQEQRASKAIVVNEFGGVEGIISMEDVLAELFGDIGDELKPPELSAEKRPDGTVRLSGSMRVEEAQTWLGVRWDGSAATIAGHIIEQLGRLPNEGESLELDGVRLSIDEMGPTTVRWVIVHPALEALPPAEEPPPPTE